MSQALSFVVAVLAIVPLSACGQQPAGTNDADVLKPIMLSSDSIGVEGGTGVYTGRQRGRNVRIEFPLAADRLNPTYYHSMERIGETGDIVAVLDTYGSGPTPDDRCETGRESWLRLFSFAERRQLDAVLVASCLERVQASDPPVVWEGDGFRTTGAAPRAYVVDARGVRPRA